MIDVIYSKVGEKINIFFEYDGYTINPPIIKNIINPNLSLQSGFPRNMEYVINNIFNYEYTIPYNISFVGTMLINIEYSTEPLSKTYQIIIKPPFGLSGNNIINPKYIT